MKYAPPETNSITRRGFLKTSLGLAGVLSIPACQTPWNSKAARQDEERRPSFPYLRLQETGPLRE
jgi:hypothetical protein